MGCASSEVQGVQGVQGVEGVEGVETEPRLPTSSASRCVVVLVPPGFDVGKFTKGFPSGFDYKFLSVGRLIRDEINKNTQYSQVILDNLEQRTRSPTQTSTSTKPSWRSCCATLSSRATS